MKGVRKNKQKVIQMARNNQTEFWENTIYLQEKDRERLAEELHDNIISRLNLIRLNVHSKNINELNLDLKNSMQLIRELTHNLTPPDLSEIELTDLIADYLEQIKTNIKVDYHQLILKENSINNQIKLNIFRILQELINNSLKHANASTIKVSLRISKQYLSLIIEDNGKGFTTGNQPSGIGLRSIQSRTKQINAIYKLKTKPQSGTKYIFFVNTLQQ
jgi:signal transduction histidine kinase